MNKEPITFQELIIIIFIFTMILLCSSCKYKHYNVCNGLINQRNTQLWNNKNTSSTDTLILHICNIDSLK